MSRYYLSKRDIKDGMVCNIIESETYKSRKSESGHIIKYDFNQIIQKDVILTQENGKMVLQRIHFPPSRTVLNQTFEEWIDMMTYTNNDNIIFPKLFVEREDPQILLKTPTSNAIIAYEHYLRFKDSFTDVVTFPHIPEIFSNFIKLEPKAMKTQELRELLKTKRLVFKFDDDQCREIIVMPRRTDEKGEPDVYVNGIHQRRLSHNHPWWGIHTNNKEYQQDWRYLLGLDWPEQPSTDKIHELFVESINVPDEEVTFLLDGDLQTPIKGRTKFEAEEMLKREKAPVGQPFHDKADLKENGLVVLASDQPPIPKKEYPKHYLKKNPVNKVILKPVSKSVETIIKPILPNKHGIIRKPRFNYSRCCELMKEATAKKIQKELELKSGDNIVKEASKLLKKSYRRENHKDLVCVKHITQNTIDRVDRKSAKEMVEKYPERFGYATKQEWKLQKRKTLKGEWNDGLHRTIDGQMSRYTGENRKVRRDNSNPKRPGHSSTSVKLTIVKVIVDDKVVRKSIYSMGNGKGKSHTPKIHKLVKKKDLKEPKIYDNSRKESVRKVHEYNARVNKKEKLIILLNKLKQQRSKKRIDRSPKPGKRLYLPIWNKEKKPIIKFNGGNPVGLCRVCRDIIVVNELYCNKHK